MNAHIETMKNALLNYQAAAMKAQDKLLQNENYFQGEYLEKQNAEVHKQLDAARAAALQQINDANERGKTIVRDWAKMDGGKITKDADLLNYGLTSAQFDELVSRYRNNGTMLNVLKQYGEKQNAAEKDPARHYNTQQIVTEAERLAAYDKFADSARSLLRDMDAPKNTVFGGAGSAMLSYGIEHFGEPTATNQGLLDLL